MKLINMDLEHYCRWTVPLSWSRTRIHLVANPNSINPTQVILCDCFATNYILAVTNPKHILKKKQTYYTLQYPWGSLSNQWMTTIANPNHFDIWIAKSQWNNQSKNTGFTPQRYPPNGISTKTSGVLPRQRLETGGINLRWFHGENDQSSAPWQPKWQKELIPAHWWPLVSTDNIWQF